MAESGWLARLGAGLSRFLGSAPRTSPSTLPASDPECAARLAARAPVLFSVFPRGGDEGPDRPPPGAPPHLTQGFGVGLAHALAWRLGRDERPLAIGLVGAGGTGKSTVFNELTGAALSRTDVLPHTTLGPVVAAPRTLELDGFLAPLALDEAPEGAGSRGAIDRAVLARGGRPLSADLLLVDLPDLNTEAAHREGGLALTLLPWMDAVVFVTSLEAFDRTVADAALELAGTLGARLALVYNRKGQKGPLVARDQADLEARAARFQALGPYVFPNLRDKVPGRDDRDALRRALAGEARVPLKRRRTAALQAALVEMGKVALERHGERAGRAARVKGEFAAALASLARDLELDPMRAAPAGVSTAIEDLRSWVGSPLELFRRLARGEGLGAAFARTFSVDARLGELDRTLKTLSETDPAAYADRLRDHFAALAGTVAGSYKALVAREPGLFVEPACTHDLEASIYGVHRPAVLRGFAAFRDETHRHLTGVRERMLGPGSRLERALAVVMLGVFVADIFVPGSSLLAVSGGYLVLRGVAPELAAQLTEHRRLRERQRALLAASCEALARGLEQHFLAGDRHLGRLEVLPEPERLELAGLLDRLAAAADPAEPTGGAR